MSVAGAVLWLLSSIGTLSSAGWLNDVVTAQKVPTPAVHRDSIAEQDNENRKKGKYMHRVATVALTILVFGTSATPALGAFVVYGGNMPGCPAAVAPTGSATTSAPVDSTPTRAPDALRVAPGVNAPRHEGIGTVISHALTTWSDGQLYGGHEVTVVFYPLPGTSAPSSGGKLASLLAGTCTQTGQWTQTDHDFQCGGGCLDQYFQRSVNTYRNDADVINTYYDRTEVRMWWTRTDTNMYFTGPAHTTFRDYMVDCNGANSFHDVYSDTSISWMTTFRTFDYYWDETWLPTVGGPNTFHMEVTLTTPESFGLDIYSEVINP
jgi:hypothetical protein